MPALEEAKKLSVDQKKELKVIGSIERKLRAHFHTVEVPINLLVAYAPTEERQQEIEENRNYFHNLLQGDDQAQEDGLAKIIGEWKANGKSIDVKAMCELKDEELNTLVAVTDRLLSKVPHATQSMPESSSFLSEEMDVDVPGDSISLLDFDEDSLAQDAESGINDKLEQLKQLTRRQLQRVNNLKKTPDSDKNPSLTKLSQKLEAQHETIRRLQNEITAGENVWSPENNLRGFERAPLERARQYLLATKRVPLEPELVQLEILEEDRQRLRENADADRALYQSLCDPMVDDAARIGGLEGKRFNKYALSDLNATDQHIILQTFKSVLRPRFDSLTGPRILDVEEFIQYYPSPRPDGALTVIKQIGKGDDGITYLVEDQGNPPKQYVAKEESPDVTKDRVPEVTTYRTIQARAGYSPYFVEFFGEMSVKRGWEDGDEREFMGTITAFKLNAERLDFFLDKLDEYVNSGDPKSAARSKQKAIIIQSIYKDLIRAARHIARARVAHKDMDACNLLIDKNTGRMVVIDPGWAQEIGVPPREQQPPELPLEKKNPTLPTGNYNSTEPAGSNSPYIDMFSEDATAIGDVLQKSGLLSEQTEKTWNAVSSQLSELATEVNKLYQNSKQLQFALETAENLNLDMTPEEVIENLELQGLRGTITDLEDLRSYRNDESITLPASQNWTDQERDEFKQRRQEEYEQKRSERLNSLANLEAQGEFLLKEFVFTAIDNAYNRALNPPLMRSAYDRNQVIKAKRGSLDREYDLEPVDESQVATITQRIYGKETDETISTPAITVEMISEEKLDNLPIDLTPDLKLLIQKTSILRTGKADSYWNDVSETYFDDHATLQSHIETLEAVKENLGTETPDVLEAVEGAIAQLNQYNFFRQSLNALTEGLDGFEASFESNKPQWETASEKVIQAIADIEPFLQSKTRLEHSVIPMVQMERFKQLKLLERYFESPQALQTDIQKLESLKTYLENRPDKQALTKWKKLREVVTEELQKLQGYLSAPDSLKQAIASLETERQRFQDLANVDSLLNEQRKPKVDAIAKHWMDELSSPGTAEGTSGTFDEFPLTVAITKLRGLHQAVPSTGGATWRSHIKNIEDRLYANYPHTMQAFDLIESWSKAPHSSSEQLELNVETLAGEPLDAIRIGEMVLRQDLQADFDSKLGAIRQWQRFLGPETTEVPFSGIAGLTDLYREFESAEQALTALSTPLSTDGTILPTEQLEALRQQLEAQSPAVTSLVERANAFVQNQMPNIRQSVALDTHRTELTNQLGQLSALTFVSNDPQFAPEWNQLGRWSRNELSILQNPNITLGQLKESRGLGQQIADNQQSINVLVGIDENLHRQFQTQYLDNLRTTSNTIEQLLNRINPTALPNTERAMRGSASPETAEVARFRAGLQGYFNEITQDMEQRQAVASDQLMPAVELRQSAESLGRTDQTIQWELEPRVATLEDQEREASIPVPLLPIATQGQITAEMAKSFLELPFLNEETGVTTSSNMWGFNDCGLQVLFRVDRSLQDSYRNRFTNREGWVNALGELKDQLIEAQTNSNGEFHAITLNGLDTEHLARLFEIRGINYQLSNTFVEEPLHQVLQNAHAHRQSFVLATRDFDEANPLMIADHRVTSNHFLILEPTPNGFMLSDSHPGQITGDPNEDKPRYIGVTINELLEGFQGQHVDLIHVPLAPLHREITERTIEELLRDQADVRSTARNDLILRNLQPADMQQFKARYREAFRIPAEQSIAYGPLMPAKGGTKISVAPFHIDGGGNAFYRMAGNAYHRGASSTTWVVGPDDHGGIAPEVGRQQTFTVSRKRKRANDLDKQPEENESKRKRQMM